MKSKNTITITVVIILLAITINYYSRLKHNDPENNQTDNKNTVKVGVTYEKLAENVELFPHPVSEEKITTLVTMTENDINQYCAARLSID